MRWWLIASVAVVGGCGAHTSAPAANENIPAAVVAQAEPATAPAPSPAPEPDATGDAGPLVIEPVEAGDGRLPHDPVVGSGKGKGRHATDFGWASDGESFALCVAGGALPRECTFTFVDGKAESPGSAAAIDRRLRADGHDKGPLEWAHGSGVKLTWSAPDGKVRLEVGARIDTGEQVHELVWMDFDPEHGDDARIFPEVVSVAPEGDRLAIVGHAFSVSRGHEFKTILLHSDDFAARAYSQAGHDHLGNERFERAVLAFEKAAAAHPNGWEHAYNLACGRARLGAGNVRRPLTQAIDLGGEKVRSKAQRDAALAGVKRTDWFKALIATKP